MRVSMQVPVPEKAEGMQEFRERLKKVKKLGYDGVELSIRDPKEIEVEKITSLIKKLGLEVSAVATCRAHTQDGLSLMELNWGKQVRALRRLKDQIEFASRFGAKVIIGLFRGKFGECDNRQKLKKDLGHLLDAYGGFAEERGVRLVLEPINRFEADFINTAQEARDFIREAKLENVGIAVNTFHMNIEEAWIAGAITDTGVAGLLEYAHLVDSNRLAPGEGHMDFEEILCCIHDSGDDVFLSVELPPGSDFEIMAEQSIKSLRKIIDWKKI